MVDRAKIVERLAELRTTAEAAEGGSSSPWMVEYFATKQRITNGAALIIAETFVGSPLPGHKALWAPEPEHIAAWSPAAVLRWLSWAEQVAARHRPVMTDKAGLPDWVAESFHPGPWCSHGETSSVLVHPRPYPCDELTGLAGALGLEET